MEVVAEVGVEVVISRITVLLRLQHQQHVQRWVSRQQAGVQHYLPRHELTR